MNGTTAMRAMIQAKTTNSVRSHTARRRAFSGTKPSLVRTTGGIAKSPKSETESQSVSRKGVIGFPVRKRTKQGS